MKNRILAGAAVLSLSATLLGTAQASAPAATPGMTMAKPQAVQVELSEWSMGMMSMTVKGPAEFDIVNVGKYPHVFTIMGKVGGQDVAVSSVLLKAGEKTSLTVSLPAGTYTVYCPLPGHADKGMKGTLTVQ